MAGALGEKLNKMAKNMFKRGSDDGNCGESLSPEETRVKEEIEEEIPVQHCGTGTGRVVFSLDDSGVVIKMARNSGAEFDGLVQNEYETAVWESVKETPFRDLLAPVVTFADNWSWTVQARVTPVEEEVDSDSQHDELLEFEQSYENRLRGSPLREKLHGAERYAHNLGHYDNQVVLFDYGAIPENSDYETQNNASLF